jgi:SAM-dependent methyltransferase
MRSKKYEEIIADLTRDVSLPDTPYRNRHIRYLTLSGERFVSDLDLIGKYYTDGTILEIGSHPYHLTYAMKRLGYDVIGLDIDPQRYDHFIKKHGLHIVKSDVEKEPLPFEDGAFRFILFNEVFEHLRIDPIKTLMEINRVLEPGGIMILSTPNLYALHRIALFLLGRGIKDPYAAFKQLHDVGHVGHIREYSEKEVRKFLTNTGWVVQDVYYRTFKYYYIYGIWGRLANLAYLVVPRRFLPYLVFINRKPSAP